MFEFSSHSDSKCLSVHETELLLASTTVGSPSVSDGWGVLGCSCSRFFFCLLGKFFWCRQEKKVNNSYFRLKEKKKECYLVLDLRWLLLISRSVSCHFYFGYLQILLFVSSSRMENLWCECQKWQLLFSSFYVRIFLQNQSIWGVALWFDSFSVLGFSSYLLWLTRKVRRCHAAQCSCHFFIPNRGTLCNMIYWNGKKKKKRSVKSWLL